MAVSELTLEEVTPLAQAFGGRARKDGKKYHLTWDHNDAGYLQFHFEGDAVWILFIRAAKQGDLTTAAAAVPPFFRQYGFTHVVTAGSEPTSKSHRWLRGIGFDRADEKGLLRGSIKEGCRFDEYAAWRRHGGNRPSWHYEVEAELGAGRA